jgi:hypothetical protein
MLSKFLRFAENIKKEDQVTFKINCEQYARNCTKLVECDCKSVSMHISIETEYMSFKYYEVCICCDKQYKYFIDKINTVYKNLCIQDSSKHPEILNLLNNQVWNNIRMADAHLAVNPDVLEYLPRTKRLIWREYRHSATLKYGFFIIHRCKETDFVTYYVGKFAEFKEDLSSIGIQVPDIPPIKACDVFIFRDAIEVHIQAISGETYGYNMETNMLDNLTLAFSIPYHYEDLNV